MRRRPEVLARIKLRHLACFLEVDRLRSARRAAETLCISESAISKTLRELEMQLGTKLFDRSKKGMVPTEAGKRFTAYATIAVDALRTGVSLAREEAGAHQTNVIRLGSMPIVSETFLPDVVRRFVQTSPRTLIEIIVGSKSTLLERVRKGQIDAVIGRLPPREEMKGLTFEHLFRDQYVFVARKGHPLAQRRRLRPDEIEPYILLMPPRETGTWHEIQRYFVANGITPRGTVIQTMDVHFSRTYCLSSDAVWLASDRSVRSDIAGGTLFCLPIETSMLEAPIGIIARPAGPPDVQLRRILKIMREAGSLPA